MHFLCPHCKNPIEIVKLDPEAEITCVACGSSFRLADSTTIGWDGSAKQELGRFTVDRLMSILNRLGSRIEVKVRVRRNEAVAHHQASV